jgi:hypothetical protein
MPNFRSILSVSPLNDLVHDRTMNALNAGCVPIIEDNTAHRRIFEHRKNALMFRYGDSSLHECFDIVCNKPEYAWEIAKCAFALRDDPNVFCVSFGNVIDVADRQLVDLRGRSVIVLERSLEDNQPFEVDDGAAIDPQALRPEEPVSRRTPLADVKRSRELAGAVDVKARLESARAAARLAQSTSATLSGYLRAKNEEVAAAQRQAELTRGETELVAERLQVEIAEARGEAAQLRSMLTLLVEHLEQAQQEYLQMFVSSLDAQEVATSSESSSEPSGLRKLAQAIGERDNRILKFAQEAVNLDGRIRTLGRQLRRRDNQIFALKRGVLERSNRIAELGQEIANRDGRILELGQEMANRDGRILELGQEMANRDSRILELGQEVANRERRILELGQEVANRERRILELEEQFGKFVSSSSWRITAPLRTTARYMSPGQVRLLQRILRLCYWALTPHRIPARLKFIRNKRALQETEASRKENSDPNRPRGHD